MNFNELGINAPILKALSEVGYKAPTPIQQQAMPPVLAGRDLLGCAQTGTGKTAAFAVPILQRLSGQKGHGVRALVLTPTRELALQIYENVCQYARYTPCTAAVIFGGVSQVPQVEALQRGADVLIATPGRLWDLMGQKLVQLDKVECFVLDEADRMLDMGFINDVKKIVKFIPESRQTLLFSATMPQEIAALADSLLKKPVRIAIKPAATPVELIEQKVYFVERAEKRDLLKALLTEQGVPQTLVFTRTKHGADRVARDLSRAGISARSLHGDKSQGARQAALRDFKEYKIAVLAATDIAARGLDISELPLVVNYELPNIPETYVHRIGRTGRAGQSGMAISFCDSTERPYLADIEKLTRQRIPVSSDVPRVTAPAEPPRRLAAARAAARREANRSLLRAGSAAPRSRRPRRARAGDCRLPEAPSAEPPPSAAASRHLRRAAGGTPQPRRNRWRPRAAAAAPQLRPHRYAVNPCAAGAVPPSRWSRASPRAETRAASRKAFHRKRRAAEAHVRWKHPETTSAGQGTILLPSRPKGKDAGHAPPGDATASRTTPAWILRRRSTRATFPPKPPRVSAPRSKPSWPNVPAPTARQVLAVPHRPRKNQLRTVRSVGERDNIANIIFFAQRIEPRFAKQRF